MKTLISNTSILLLLLVVLSCKKDEIPVDTDTTPVFTFNGTIAGNSVSILAGKDDYYMYSSVSSDLNSLKTYTANLSKTTCVDCPNSLKISIIDYNFSSPNQTILDSTFYLGNYNFATASGIASRYNVQFTKVTLGPAQTGINWDFGDGTSKVELSPSHTYVRPGEYPVCMNAQFLGGCTSNLCNSLRLGNLGEFCEAGLVDGPAVGTSITFAGTGSQGTSPYTYFWNFGDGLTSVDQNPTHTFASEGVYTVTLTVTDAAGLTHTKRQNVRTQNSSDCVARYTYAVNAISNPNNFGNIVIEWRDANGILYTSKNDNQPLRSYFKINSIEEYNLNENNQKTKKLNVTFSCTLYNGASQIEVKNATAVIAVAY